MTSSIKKIIPAKSDSVSEGTRRPKILIAKRRWEKEAGEYKKATKSMGRVRTCITFVKFGWRFLVAANDNSYEIEVCDVRA